MAHKSRKYEFTGETKNHCGVKLHRIRAIADIAVFGIYSGDEGGWIASEKNLSHGGSAWVFDEAYVYDNAIVDGDARISDNARVYGSALVFGNVYDNARVYGYALVADNVYVQGDARVYGSARVAGNANIFGDARVYGYAQVDGNAQVYGYGRISGDVCVSGYAHVSGDAHVYNVNIVATRSDGCTFLVAPPRGSGPVVVIARDFYSTLPEARDYWDATLANTPLGEETTAILDHLERMARIQGWSLGLPAN